jgi:hypothetical protein
LPACVDPAGASCLQQMQRNRCVCRQLVNAFSAHSTQSVASNALHLGCALCPEWAVFHCWASQAVQSHVYGVSQSLHTNSHNGVAPISALSCSRHLSPPAAPLLWTSPTPWESLGSLGSWVLAPFSSTDTSEQGNFQLDGGCCCCDAQSGLEQGVSCRPARNNFKSPT